jgi:hypothetical protein
MEEVVLEKPEKLERWMGRKKAWIPAHPIFSPRTPKSAAIPQVLDGVIQHTPVIP